MLVVVSLQWNCIFYPLNLFFGALDFSHGKYIMLHEATAKLMFLVCFVVSLQRGAPFLMYGMVDSSFIHKQWVVCVCAFEELDLSKKVTRTLFFLLARELSRTAKSCFCLRPGSLWVPVPRNFSFCSGRCRWHWAHSKAQVAAKVCKRSSLERDIESVSKIAREDL